MVIITKDNLIKDIRVVMEIYILKVELISKDIGKMIRLLDKEK
jgi:hypothetical protein